MDLRIELDNDIGTALRSLKGSRLRTRLTVAIMAVGVMSIVGIQTALDIMTEKIAGSFEGMGAWALTISSCEGNRPLSEKEAFEFRDCCEFAARVSVSSARASLQQVKSNSTATDPVVDIVASDPQYLAVNSLELSSGRNITEVDLELHSKIALIGDSVRRKLFGEDASGVGRTIVAGGMRYTVAGELARQGAMFGTGADNSVVVPLDNDAECLVTLIPSAGSSREDVARSCDALMRSIRRIRLGVESDFEISEADSLQGRLASVKSRLSLAALAVGIVTMLGSAVGLMNIMLVSVKERIRETGTRKALGARSSDIMRQFLLESVIIGQMGAVTGTLLGLLFGNLVALMMDGGFAVPWRWLLVSVIMCFMVSVLSGVVPARLAASLTPVEALREE